jgi:SAM-dependent methyltransferase
MKELEQLQKIYSQDLDKRRNWYSPVAEAYNRVRPSYPQQLVLRAQEIAQLTSQAKILELGCGPGKATVAFAELGYSMVCLEPSYEACEYARQNSAKYPNVEIRQTTFEEWELTPGKFDAVLAATSFHWIDPKIACTKAADALKDDGSLILLWNMTPQPSYEVYQNLIQVYQTYAPELAGYEEQATQAKIAQHLKQKALECDCFTDLVSEELMCEVSYSVDDFLLLLSTFSPYIKLELPTREALFTGLREKIVANYGGKIPIKYLSILQVGKKISR